MKKLDSILAVATAILVCFAMAADTAEAKAPQYVGVDGCASCHRKDAKGNQLAQWQQSRHSKAYETLATARADSVFAQVTGGEFAAGTAQKADQWLQCHVTAHGVADSLIATPRGNKEGHVVTDGVACETCHGPGSIYKKRKTMKDRDASIAAGLILPDEALCLTCHNDSSPTYKEFNFEKRLAEVTHPDPSAP